MKQPQGRAGDLSEEQTMLLSPEPTKMQNHPIRPSGDGQDYVPFADESMEPTRVPPSAPSHGEELPTQMLDSVPPPTRIEQGININEEKTRVVTSPPLPTPPSTAGPDTRTAMIDRSSPTISAAAIPAESIGPDDKTRTNPQGTPAPPRSSVTTSSDRHGVDTLIGRHVGGYVLKKKLGAGGMGSVFLAHQVSLDREVAVKVLPPSFAEDPGFIARFTREALTAAQLNHHNVIQVIDVGSQDDIHYISMEFVRGKDLGGMTRTDGKLAFEDAAGYVLQAARGLLYAHQRGIIHRDIKPDNIMVNEHGIVKVADMGLAKMSTRTDMIDDRMGLAYGAEDELRRQARGELTGASVAMGTPSYMAPEQGQDASTVDHRADQYSLGCTLYYLIAGKAPFSGKTSFEIISKHMSEPVAPLDTIVKNVPPELSIIIEKMLAKDPVDRYPSLKGVVEDLEAYLGIDSREGPYTPREHHLDMLDQYQKQYYGASSIKLRKFTRLGFIAASVILILVSALLLKSVFTTAAFLGLLVLTPLFSFVFNGIRTKDYLFRRVRSVFFGMSLKSWMFTAVGTILGLLLLHFFQLLIPWVVVSVAALGLAVAYQIFIIRKLRAERAKSLADCQEMFRTLRVRGVSEDALQDFVCRYAGDHWEEMFEDLFGYEDMILMRGLSAKREKVRHRRKFATWRDPIARWLDDIEESRKKAREQKALAKAEKHRLKAQGLDDKEAEKQADALAGEAMAEGLLKETALLDAVPSKAQAEKAAVDLSKARRRKGKIFWLYRFVRLAFAVVVIAAAAHPLAMHYAGTGLPDFLITLLGKFYYPLGLPLGQSVTFNQTIFAAVAGLILLFSLFSGRVILPTLVLAGTVFLTFAQPIMELAQRDLSQPLNYYGALGGGIIAVLGGFVLMILMKIGGSKY